MNKMVLSSVLTYVEEEHTPVQITYEDGEFVVDFKYMLHANVCFEELKDKGFKNLQLDFRPHYARIV